MGRLCTLWERGAVRLAGEPLGCRHRIGYSRTCTGLPFWCGPAPCHVTMRADAVYRYYLIPKYGYEESLKYCMFYWLYLLYR